MHLFENLARIFKLLLKSNRKKKHLYSLKEHLTRKLHRSQKKTNPRVLLHLRHQPADLVTVSPMLNARNLANLATSPSIALRKRTPAQIHAMLLMMLRRQVRTKASSSLPKSTMILRNMF